MVRNIQEIKNPGGSNHLEQLVAKVSWSTPHTRPGHDHHVGGDAGYDDNW